MRFNPGLVIVFITILFSLNCSQKDKPSADLILKNGEVYTMDPGLPWACTIIIKENRIIKLLSNNNGIDKYTGPQTKTYDLKGKFVLPGFIDAHVHFNRAGSLINDINLMKVADDAGLREEIRRVVKIIGQGEWITNGLWGAYEHWEFGSDRAGVKNEKRWYPSKKVIDDLTKSNPVLLSSYDGELYLANSAALELADLMESNLPGVKYDKDQVPSGIIYKGSKALEKIRKLIKHKSHKRLMEESRAALKELARSGIVEIHDIAVPDQTKRFIELQQNGELTCRVWLRPDLARVREMIENGFAMGVHPKTGLSDSWLRYGALKGYIDGIMGNHSALFFRPYNDQPDNMGHYRRHTSDDPNLFIPNLDKMYNYIKTGYNAGFVANVHAIGTKGVALMLDIYERLMKETQKDLTGYRVIHAQVIRQQDFARFKKLNVIAEVNPYHISDDMRWMEQRIGIARCRGAYAFKSLLDNGAILCFGSDWPGTNVAEYHVHPKYMIYAAVNRTTIKGTPAGGWFPEQKISIHEALKAYTVNNAYAAFEGDKRGSIQVGKLADITVCDRNLIRIDPKEILKMNVLMTIVDGRIVFNDLDHF